jgi:hypothetical protein
MFKLMTNKLIFCCIAFIFSCNYTTPKENTLTQTCPDVRSQICTMDYRPVCGIGAGKLKKTSSNQCQACADKTVTSYSEGEC